MDKRFCYPSIHTFNLTKLASAGLAVFVTLSSTLGANALDPFRTTQPRNIGDNTEAAFKAIFLQGDYQAADRFLQKAIATEPSEPLAYAMKASLAYTNNDIAGLDTYSQKTLQTAQKLITTDALRGNLYAAVGEFLGGAVILTRQGTVNGAPAALSRLRKVYDLLDKAEKISPQDPELNLLKGYMDLMLAVNLPFADPSQAIQRLEKNAAPQYLADRGIAIAYRDLKQYDKGLQYADRALKGTPDNPEVQYLKAQILRAKANKDKNPTMMREAVSMFDKALTRKSQLPSGLVKQIERERRNADSSVANLGK
ncbi:TPR repeat-containing protein [Rivularia sp. IAM M-261]|nr:TPR repeat-containing protein [Calothrix sp. PCC 7716]GJD21596.1 TPR repeat-containing protein [Rivularia sp. IAM M-261]